MYYSLVANTRNAAAKCYKGLPVRITKNYNVWTCCSLRPASLRSGVRRSDNQSDTKRYPNLACVTPRPHSRAPKQQQQQQQQHWAHPQKDKQLRYHWRAALAFCLKQGQLVRLFLSANGLSQQGQSRQNGKAGLAAVTAAAPQALKMKKTCSQRIWTIPPNPQNAESWKSDGKSQMLDGLKS